MPDQVNDSGRADSLKITYFNRYEEEVFTSRLPGSLSAQYFWYPCAVYLSLSFTQAIVDPRYPPSFGHLVFNFDSPNGNMTIFSMPSALAFSPYSPADMLGHCAVIPDRN